MLLHSSIYTAFPCGVALFSSPTGGRATVLFSNPQIGFHPQHIQIHHRRIDLPYGFSQPFPVRAFLQERHRLRKRRVFQQFPQCIEIAAPIRKEYLAAQGFRFHLTARIRQVRSVSQSQLQEVLPGILTFPASLGQLLPVLSDAEPTESPPETPGCFRILRPGSG